MTPPAPPPYFQILDPPLILLPVVVPERVLPRRLHRLVFRQLVSVLKLAG